MILAILGIAAALGLGGFAFFKHRQSTKAAAVKPVVAPPGPAPIIPPVKPPVVNPPGPVPVVPPVYAPALVPAANGFISVPQIPSITQPNIVDDGNLCTVLALSYLTPGTPAFERVKQNCDECSYAEAESKALGQSAWHNTAYDVDQQPDGSWKINPNKPMLKTFVVPTEVNIESQVVAYCNAYPTTNELWKVATPTGAPGSGMYEQRMVARRKKAGA